jgi:hypothetical protein
MIVGSSAEPVNKAPLLPGRAGVFCLKLSTALLQEIAVKTYID